jgi:hypothetical protein
LHADHAPPEGPHVDWNVRNGPDKETGEFIQTVVLSGNHEMNIEFKVRKADVVEWAKSSLRDSLALSFSHCLAEQVNWEKAEFSLWGDSALSQEALLEFRYGGKVSGKPSTNANDWLRNSLVSYGDTKKDFVLTEEWILRPGSEFVGKMPAVFNGDEVYFFIGLHDLTSVTDEKLHGIFANQVPLFHGFLIHGGSMPVRGDVMDVDRIKELCKHVKLIFFGIYDGESYLVCHLGNL